jgi:hypothetical protein
MGLLEQLLATMAARDVDENRPPMVLKQLEEVVDVHHLQD